VEVAESNAESNGDKDVWVARGKMIAMLGAPAVIALYLVYLLGQFSTNGVTSLLVEARKANELVIEHVKATQESEKALKQLLFRICYNTAQTDDQRTRCSEAY
jgi:hypothetical protein